jgi:hypothetical protein
MDALGSHAHYRNLHRRILMGYVLDAMDARGSHASDKRGGKGPGSSVPPSVAQEFVEGMKRARRTPSESVGSGEYRILDGPVLGGELVEDGHLVHLSAFPNLNGDMEPGREDIPSMPLARPSHRRRRY